MTARTYSQGHAGQISGTQFEVETKKGPPRKPKGTSTWTGGMQKRPAPSFCPVLFSFAHARFEIRTLWNQGRGLVVPPSERMTPLKRGYRSEILLTMLGFACACPLKHNSPQRPRLFPQELGLFFWPKASRHNFHPFVRRMKTKRPAGSATWEADNRGGLHLIFPV